MQNIKHLIQAGYSGIAVTSYEEARVERDIMAIARELKYSIFTWSITNGVVRHAESGVESIVNCEDPIDMLSKFMELPEKTIMIAADLHLFVEQRNPMILRKIKDALRVGKGSNRVLFMLGCQCVLQPEIEKEMALVEFTLPGKDTLGAVLDSLCGTAGVVMEPSVRVAALDAASGLTTQESEDAFALSIVEQGRIDPGTISRMKTQAVKKSGILEIVETATDFNDVGGLAEAKDWLRRRKAAFSPEALAYGLPVPKGILAVGVPGSGKSMLAKATASMFGVPLLKLDGGALFGSLVGESEKNMRIAIATAEAIAPCVLVIDEIEKALSGSKSSGSTDGGTSSRVLGTFLSWMQDKTSPVFVMATCNSVEQLPPELLRKGRWDEMFFVDLPGDDERAEIWRIQIARKNRKPEDYDVPKLVQQTLGWTGAEIEGAYNEAMFCAFETNEQPHQGKHLEHAVEALIPLSKTAAEDINKLRQWAQGRARFASAVRLTAVTNKHQRKVSLN